MPYGDPGAAFSSSMDEFLITQQALEHQKFMDDLATKRETRLAEADRLDNEIRREELKGRRDEAVLRRQDKKLSDNIKKRSQLVPGDIPSKELIDESAELGIPLRLGATPTIPAASGGPVEMPGVGRVQLPQTPSPAQSFPQLRPYAGSREDLIREGIANAVSAPNADRRTTAASALRLGVDPKELSAVMTAVEGPQRALSAQSTFGAFTPDGKQLDGIVSMDPTSGEPRINGQPLPDGVTVRRIPAPRDPIVDALARASLTEKRDANAQVEKPIEPGSPEYQMAQDLADKKLVYEDIIRAYSFQRTGREQARKIYQLARQINPSLNPVSIRADLKAYQGEFNKLQQQRGAVEAYAGAADLNAQRLESLLSKIPDTGFSGKPNDWLRHATSFMGGEDIKAFNLLMTSLQSEYGRLISNPNLTGVVTDATRQEYRDLLDKGATIGQIKRLLGELKAESSNRRKGIDQAISDVREQIGGDETASSPQSQTPRRSPDDILKAVTGAR